MPAFRDARPSTSCVADYAVQRARPRSRAGSDAAAWWRPSSTRSTPRPRSSLRHRPVSRSEMGVVPAASSSRSPSPTSSGRTLSGQTLEAFWSSMPPRAAQSGGGAQLRAGRGRRCGPTSRRAGGGGSDHLRGLPTRTPACPNAFGELRRSCPRRPPRLLREFAESGLDQRWSAAAAARPPSTCAPSTRRCDGLSPRERSRRRSTSRA